MTKPSKGRSERGESKGDGPCENSPTSRKAWGWLCEAAGLTCRKLLISHLITIEKLFRHCFTNEYQSFQAHGFETCHSSGSNNDHHDRALSTTATFSIIHPLLLHLVHSTTKIIQTCCIHSLIFELQALEKLPTLRPPLPEIAFG